MRALMLTALVVAAGTLLPRVARSDAPKTIVLVPGKGTSLTFKRDRRTAGTVRRGSRRSEFVRVENIRLVERGSADAVDPDAVAGAEDEPPVEDDSLSEWPDVTATATPRGVEISAKKAKVGGMVYTLVSDSRSQEYVFQRPDRGRPGTWVKGKELTKTHRVTVVLTLGRSVPGVELSREDEDEIEFPRHVTFVSVGRRRPHATLTIKANNLLHVAAKGPGKKYFDLTYMLDGKKYKTRLPVTVTDRASAKKAKKREPACPHCDAHGARIKELEGKLAEALVLIGKLRAELVEARKKRG